MHYLILIVAFMLNHTMIAQRTNPLNQPVELGQVSWYRNYDKALEVAAVAGKKVFILFQEVPGCSTCRNYGHDVLSNPLLTEVIENEFVPLVIYNNEGGHDGVILRKYGEPTWNNPVVHIVDTEGNDVVPRIARNYSAVGVFKALKEALDDDTVAMNEYIQLLQEDLNSVGVAESYFSMACFWSGEAELGAIDGVLNTEPAWMSGREVVKVEYDPNVVNRSELDKQAQERNNNPIAKHKSYRIDRDPEYYLKNSGMRYLALSSLQRTKINAALGLRKDARVYLSPKQVTFLKNLDKIKKKDENMYRKDFNTAWGQMLKSLSNLD